MRNRKKKSIPLSKSQQMARVRNKDTAPELTLRKQLWRAGIRYRLRPKLPGTPDLIMPRAKVAIFVDGCFWHGCPIHYVAPATNVAFWRDKLAKNRLRDEATTQSLENQGWRVLRFWEHELKDDMSSAIERIKSALQSSS